MTVPSGSSNKAVVSPGKFLSRACVDVFKLDYFPMKESRLDEKKNNNKITNKMK